MTPAGMAAMRIAATLVHVLPALRVRVRHRGETLLEVAAHPAGATGPAISPCAFRRAVTSAHEHARYGQPVAFLGVPADEDPAVDIGVRAGDGALPGGIYRVGVGDQTIHGFATTLTPRRCRQVLEGIADTGHVVRLHHDAATEVTFVHTVIPTAEAPSEAAHLGSALEALLADEVVCEVAGIP